MRPAILVVPIVCAALGCATAEAPEGDGGASEMDFSGQVPNSGLPPEVFPNPPASEPAGTGGSAFPPFDAGQGGSPVAPPAGGELPPPRSCDSGCQDLVTCAREGGRCAALPADFPDLCRVACERDPAGFLAALDAFAGCDALIGQLEADPEFCALCHGRDAPACGGGLPEPEPEPEPGAPGARHPECGPVGENLGSCVIQACPNAGGPLAQGLMENLAYACDQQWADIEPQAQAIAQATCEQLAEVVDNIIQSMGSLCANGPVLDAGTCRAGCQRYIGCLPPEVPADDPGRDPDLCLFACAVYPENSAIFSCAAVVGDCQELQGCFP